MDLTYLTDWLKKESKRYRKLSENDGHLPSIHAYRGKAESYDLFASMLSDIVAKQKNKYNATYYCIDCKDTISVGLVIDPLAFKVCGDDSKYPLCTCCLLKRHIKADNAPTYFG